MRILEAKKKSALSRGTFGCIGEVATLNVTRGCAAACAFCYARSYTGAPEPGTLLFYRGLPAQLRQELDSRRRKRPPPRYVLIGTAADPFIGGEPVLSVTRACLEVLLRRDIGVSLMTRGEIPEETIALLGRHAPLVQITVPLVSLDDDYTRAWEPGTALPKQRLFLIQRLQRAGLEPNARIEPIIPFINDKTEALRSLISALVGLGLKRSIASLIQLRPGVANQIRRDAPEGTRRLVLGAFASVQQQRRVPFDHLPPKQAMGVLRRLQKIASDHGAQVAACGCQNPGLPAARCPIIPEELPSTPRGVQHALFEADHD